MPRRAKRHATASSLSSSSQRFGIRESAARRGYGRKWQAKRADQLAKEPTCRSCRERGVTELANEVDHIVPTQGEDDPNHYDDDNLQSLCKSCHSAKTLRDMAAGVTRVHRRKQRGNR